MDRINDWLLNAIGFNTAPNPYSKGDWMGGPQGARKRLTDMGVEGKSEDEIRELEKRKYLPKSVQLQLLSRNK